MIRHLLALLLFAAPAAAQVPAGAEPPKVTRSHALTILGTPALPPDFANLPYANPSAPKGGTIVFGDTGSFDGFNPYILRGNAARGISEWQRGVGGTSAGSAGGHVWEHMLNASADEVATAYCHVCATVETPADGLWVAFEIRPEAKFADGRPITAEDVVWSFDTLRDKGRPSIAVQLTDVKDAVAESERRVVFHFKTNLNRELPLMVGGLPILPKHWWATRDFTKPLTEPPLGSGPYKVDSFVLGRTVTYVRDPNWWARDQPTGRGLFNFDRVRIEYFRDPTVLFEAFKAGQIDWRQENVSKQWNTAYDFAAVTDGLVIKDRIEHKLPIGIQGLLFNTRRTVFKDPRVREALGQVWDFEFLNKTLFYEAYTRTDSYFGNSGGRSSGLPDAAEVALLAPFRDQVPQGVFTEPFKLVPTDGSGNNREGLRRALALLKDAGWTIKDRKLVDAAGAQMTFSILAYDPGSERVLLPYKQWLQRLGVEVAVRIVDIPQFERLTNEFDFDMAGLIYPGSELPGNEMRDYFGCTSAKTEGGGNLAGICTPATEALIDTIVKAQSREELFAATRALDRILLRGWFMIPEYHDTTFRTAYWNRFGRPTTPLRTGFVLDSWWVDPALAVKVDAARKSAN